MTSGVVTSVSPHSQGTTLAAGTSPIDAVLSVVNASDFAEDFSTPRFLMIGEPSAPGTLFGAQQALQYVAVQNDEDLPQTVTLSGIPSGIHEAGTPVVLWDPTIEGTDKRARQFRASVELDGQPEGAAIIPVIIPHDLVPLAGAYSLVGAHVVIAQDDDDEWKVSVVKARTPSVASQFFRIPYASAVLPADLSIPATGLLVVKTWQVSEMTELTYDSATGVFWFAEDGMYRATFGATYEANATGSRRLVPRKHFTDGTNEALRAVQVGANSGVATAFEVTVGEHRFLAGEGLSFETSQSSGAALLLIGNGGVRNRPTEVTIVRAAP